MSTFVQFDAAIAEMLRVVQPGALSEVHGEGGTIS
jgi:hypothetical protein